MNNLLEKYKELSIKHKELCFKVKEGNFFVIGIMTNNGPIVCKFDIKYYDYFNIIELNSLDYFDKLENASTKKLDETNFSNVGFFIIEDKKLVKYIGNQKTIIIPNNIDTLLKGSFSDNDSIVEIYGKNVKDIQHYTFKNNKSLITLSFPSLVWLGNILNVPNLKNYTISNQLFGMINEDNDYTNSTVTVNDTTYYFDDDLERDFMETVEVMKESPEEQIQLVKISDGERKFRSVKDNYRNETIRAISHLDKQFNELPDFIKDIFYNTKCIIYVVDQLPDAGEYYVDRNIILVHRTQIKYAFYHEIGHMIDYYLNRISETYDFKRIYYSEAHKLYSNDKSFDLRMNKSCIDHLKMDSQEYFAESVKRYLSGDKSFQSECPNTFMFIKDTFDYLERNQGSALVLK